MLWIVKVIFKFCHELTQSERTLKAV